jgi:hypothetical protein
MFAEAQCVEISANNSAFTSSRKVRSIKIRTRQAAGHGLNKINYLQRTLISEKVFRIMKR